MTSVEIRQLTERDAAIYWRMRLEALEREPESFSQSADEHRKTTVESAAERLAATPGESFVFGAFHDGQLAGTAGFFRFTNTKERHKGKIWGVYVRPTSRRQGIGRSLLVALLGKIRTCQGVERVSLTVVSGQGAARELYLSLGFKTYGVEPRALKVGDRYLDDEHMVLQLWAES